MLLFYIFIYINYYSGYKDILILIYMLPGIKEEMYSELSSYNNKKNKKPNGFFSRSIK